LVIFRKLLIVDQAACNPRVAVDAAITQEGPIAACVFDQFQVDLAEQGFFLVV